MATAPALLDTDLLRSFLGPQGAWAKRCGAEVRRRREDLGWSLARLAELCDSNAQTLSRVETGVVVPRDYLRASIAHALCCEVQQLWPLTRVEIMEIAA